MLRKKIVKIFFILIIFLTVLILAYFKFFKKDKETVNLTIEKEETFTNSNIITDVKYTTKDVDGNEYVITALKGEIDYANSNILFLTSVKALIKLKNSEKVTITSDFGKYNTDNYDTIFSKNVIINYLDNKIIGEYLDFSIERNSMVISKKVIYSNPDNFLKADVIEINLKTKDTKIFMLESQKK